MLFVFFLKTHFYFRTIRPEQWWTWTHLRMSRCKVCVFLLYYLMRRFTHSGLFKHELWEFLWVSAARRAPGTNADSGCLLEGWRRGLTGNQRASVSGLLFTFFGSFSSGRAGLHTAPVKHLLVFNRWQNKGLYPATLPCSWRLICFMSLWVTGSSVCLLSYVSL